MLSNLSSCGKQISIYLKQFSIFEQRKLIILISVTKIKIIMMAKKEKQLDLLTEEKGNYGHGGSRAGSGRKKGAGSKLIRVPSLLVGKVEALITKYKSDDMDFDINEHITKRIEQLEQDKKGQTFEVKSAINNVLVELKNLQNILEDEIENE